MSTQIAESNRTPAVFAKDGAVFTNSRDVAAFFEKRHDHVLRDIGNLISQEPSLAEGCGPNFGETSREVPMPNGGTRSERSFDMSRDGFTLLAMGFTGEKALKWKLRYIEAFNAMEAQIKSALAQPPIDPANITRMQLIEIAMQAEKERLQLEHKVGALEPKATFYDKFANADGLFTLQNAARVLGQRPNKFIGRLKAGYLFYQGAALVPKVQYSKMGIFEVKTALIDDKARHQTFVTPRGLQYLSKKLGLGLLQPELQLEGGGI